MQIHIDLRMYVMSIIVTFLSWYNFKNVVGDIVIISNDAFKKRVSKRITSFSKFCSKNLKSIVEEQRIDHFSRI